MYTKRRTLTIPVEYKEVVVPHDKIPDDTDVRFLYHGQETQGTPTQDGVLIAYSDNDIEEVTVEYGDVEEKEPEDVVTPILEALRDIPQPKEVNIQPIIDALKGVEEAVYATEKEQTTSDERVPLLLESIRDVLTSEKEQAEEYNYNAMLGYIADMIPKGIDTSEIVSLLRKVLEQLSTPSAPVQPFDLPRDNEGRIKVEVDRTGFGGLTGPEANNLKSIAQYQPTILTALTQEYTILIDDEYPITYIGEAVPGTATSAPEWRVKKIDETTADTTIKYAGGGAFTQVWNNRASLTYA